MVSNLATRHEGDDFYASLKARADEIEGRYRELSPISARLSEEAKAFEPGGYTRDAVRRKPYTLYIEKGEGSVLTDSDGRRIVDMWFNSTALPLGHGDPRVVAVVNAQVAKGTAFFARTESEIELARIICDRLPSAERVRFANSGSEAVMLALRIARGFTERDLVIKFEGCYHGSYDDVLWSVGPPKEKFGPAESPTPVAATAGLPAGLGRTLVLPFNDLSALERAMASHRDELAGVIMEPMANRMGLIVPSQEFLEGARRLCDDHGAVLIFDEVIAFRLGFHGAQGFVGVDPDLTAMGKVIGGGFPVGAIAGREEVMSVTDPDRVGRVAHFGTFNANPVTMAAGKATMEALTPDVFEHLNARGAGVRRRLEELCDGLPLRITGAGSLFKVNATSHEITDYRSSLTRDAAWERIASLALLNEGFMLTSGLHGTIGTSTTDGQLDAFLSAFEAVIRS